MKYFVRVINPMDLERSALCEALIDLAGGHPLVPADVYQNLALPEWAILEFEGRSTGISVEPSSDLMVHIRLAMLTALGLEMDRTTGELTSFEPLLPLLVQ
jgi:hypothetical protein